MTTPPEPVSEEEFAAAFSGKQLPADARLDDLTWMIPVPWPGGPRLAYTLCYALADIEGGVHLIDPGWRGEDEATALHSSLLKLGLGPVRSVIATHAHPDHAAGMGVFQDAGASIVMHRKESDWASRFRVPYSDEDLDAWGVPPSDRGVLPQLSKTRRGPRPDINADVLVEDGDLLAIPGRRIRVVHTPGHTAGHICLVDEDTTAVFTGDHVLPAIHPGLGLGGDFGMNPVAAAMESLRRIRDLETIEVRPGHEYRFVDLSSRVDGLIDHHRRRTSEVDSAMSGDPHGTVWQVASRVSWTAGWQRLKTEPFVYSALAQVAMHMELVQSNT